MADLESLPDRPHDSHSLALGRRKEREEPVKGVGTLCKDTRKARDGRGRAGASQTETHKKRWKVMSMLTKRSAKPVFFLKWPRK